MTVASLATTTTSRPWTRTIPPITPAPGAASSYMPPAASPAQLEEGAAGIGQPLDPLARQQLAALDVASPRLLATAERGALEPAA